jgi:phage repressor protein C with HTH and peptisase S24 domain
MKRGPYARFVETAAGAVGGQAELARLLTEELGSPYDRSKVQKMCVGKRAVSAAEAVAISAISGIPSPQAGRPAARRMPLSEDGDPIQTVSEKPSPHAIAQTAGRIGGGSTSQPVTIEVAGHTREVVDGWWQIPAAVLQMAHSRAPNVVAFRMDGDSMEPIIQRTDIVFIDTTRRELEPDGVWAVDYGLGRTMKRVLVRRSKDQVRYILKSDNETYPEEEYSPEEVTIIGRYIGRFSVF